ncbi:MAG: twin-arginine translocase TatA/TatE family subunit [Acidimicrobiales bacterium]
MTIDPTKLLIVAVVALIVLGPEKLPTVLRQLGRYWSTFRSVRDTIQKEMGATLSSITEPGAAVRREATNQISQIRGALDVFRTPSRLADSVYLEEGSGNVGTPPAPGSVPQETQGGSVPRSSSPSDRLPGASRLGESGSSAYLPGSPELN